MAALERRQARERASGRRPKNSSLPDCVVDSGTGCWVWRWAKTTAGYGHTTKDGKAVYAHRLYYEAFVAEIPPGYVVDHLCRNPACCNPDHLEAVTQTMNMRRTQLATCGRGHPMSGENLYVAPGDGGRQCRECNRIRDRARVRRRAEEYRERGRAEILIGQQSPQLVAPALDPIPVGKCQCGCGGDTHIAKKTVSAKGIVKGLPMRYLRGHAGSWRETGGYAIDLASGCWLWQRSTSLNGYGQAWHEGKLHRAHRLFYELYVGRIPEGMHLDHTCRNRLCVNPDHLEPVTPLENVRRTPRGRDEN